MLVFSCGDDNPEVRSPDHSSKTEMHAVAVLGELREAAAIERVDLYVIANTQKVQAYQKGHLVLVSIGAIEGPDGQLRALVAHELGHIALLHTEKSRAFYALMPRVAGCIERLMFGGELDLLGDVFRMCFEQAKEIEADRLAVVLMEKCKYAATLQSLKELLSLLLTQENDPDNVESLRQRLQILEGH